jgi:hypothetical protein
MSEGVITSHILAKTVRRIRSRKAGQRNHLERTLWSSQNVREKAVGAKPMTILTIRKHQRFAVRREAGLQIKGRASRTGLLVELSLEGCRMSIVGAAKFAVGQTVKVNVAGYGALKAQVRWSDTGVLGMRFDQPLHVAELNELLAACRPEFANDSLVRAYGT